MQYVIIVYEYKYYVYMYILKNNVKVWLSTGILIHHGIHICAETEDYYEDTYVGNYDIRG